MHLIEMLTRLNARRDAAGTAATHTREGTIEIRHVRALDRERRGERGDAVNIPSVASHQPHNPKEQPAKVAITSTAPSDRRRVVSLDDTDLTR
jgi:uncharacterized RmlC-like cupin family protein